MKPTAAGVCNRCGGANDRTSHRWCKPCFNETRQSRWRFRKIDLVQRKGGKCSSCGWEPRLPKEYAAIDFHHTDPSKKKWPVAGNWFLSKNVEEEAAKCVLLCANCHRIHHAQEWAEPDRDNLLFRTRAGKV